MDPTNTSATGKQNAFTWLVSWLMMLLLLLTLAQTEWGKRIVYYVAWLSVVLLIVTHSSELTSLFGGFTQDALSNVEKPVSAPPPGSFPPTGGIPGGKV